MASSKSVNGTTVGTDEDVERIVKEYAGLYRPIITLDQACEIAHEKKATLYEWSSQGRLEHCKARPGRRLKFKRDLFVRFVLSQ